MSASAVDMGIEVPRGSRNKYEFDHDRHVLHLDRRLFSATAYPADYGFIPDTLAEDGDPAGRPGAAGAPGRFALRPGAGPP